MRLEIRESRPDDWPAMIGLGGDDDASSQPATDPGLLDHPLIQASLDPQAISLIAREDQTIVGVLVCGGKDSPSQVRHLRVSPAHQSLGVDRALIDKLLFKLRSRGIHTLQLSADLQDTLDFWDQAKWQGRRDLQGQIPLGRSPACSLT